MITPLEDSSKQWQQFTLITLTKTTELMYYVYMFQLKYITLCLKVEVESPHAIVK